MQIYMKINLIYSFDKEKTFKAKYMAKNSKLTQKHKEYNK